MSAIYLDNAASTPVDPCVLSVYIRASQKYIGNPSNDTHQYGRDAKIALETARVKIGDHLGLDHRGIIFTSGATEANNLALQGLSCLQPKKCAAIISSIEHACIDESARILLKRGVNVKFIPTKPSGIVDLEKLEKLVKETKNVKFISVMLVNNETGVIQPIHEVSKIAKKAGAIFHTDAVQGIGKLPIGVLKLADMVSISCHKINGPKGIGCLWVKPHVKLKPMLVGGGQEFGIRSGTSPLPLIMAFAKAIEVAVEDAGWLLRVARPMKIIENTIGKAFPGILVNGAESPRVPSILNLSFPFEKRLIDSLQGLAVAPGAACGCAKPKPSKVLLSMGLDEKLARNVIRISAGRFTTPGEILKAGCIIKSAIQNQ
jgi:cysteine desulfurase